MSDSPPPLKQSLASAVALELHQGRGDPAEVRRLEQLLEKERQTNETLQSLLANKEKERETQMRLMELRVQETQKKFVSLQEENARLRLAVKPEDLSHLDEVFRVIAREKQRVERDRESLRLDREEFEAQKLKFENLRSDKVKQAFVIATNEAAHSAVIAQRVQEFVRKFSNCSFEEIRDIRESLQETLQQKLAEIQ